MNAEEAVQQVKLLYPEFIADLSKVENNLIECLEYYKVSRPSWVHENDFRPGFFGRMLTVEIVTRKTIQYVLEAIIRDDWELEYINSLPKFYQDLEYYRHINDMSRNFNFMLIQQVFSQFETTNRIIFKTLKIKKGDPIIEVNNEIKAFDKDFLKFVKAIRNTVHNNGFYFPRAWESDFIYLFNGKNYKFETGKSVLFDFSTAVQIFSEINRGMSNGLKSKLIEDCPLTIDIA